MEKLNKNYLTARNVLIILLLWLCLIFLNPSGNSWINSPVEYWQNRKIFFIGEIIFLMLCFSYKSLIDKNYKKAALLSIFSVFNLGVTYYLVFSKKIEVSILPFFHPITISLTIIFLTEKKIKSAVAGYILGYFLSYSPLMGSLIPILFLQLWLDSLTQINISGKLSRFLSRLMMYLITSALISFMIFAISHESLLFPSVSFSKVHEMIIVLITVIMIYLILNQYLKLYYSKYANKVLMVLSYIPVLWVIPLFEIIVYGKERGDNKL